MGKYLLSLFVLFCVILTSYSFLYAGGIGLFIPTSYGTIDYGPYDSDMHSTGIGFMYDTNTGSKKLFNYRLSMNIEFFKHDYSYKKVDSYSSSTNTITYDSEKGTYEVYRIITDHSFGFGLHKSRFFRIWIGPLLRFGIVSSPVQGNCYGIGITFIGINFNIASSLSLVFEADYLYNYDHFHNNLETIIAFNGTNLYDKHINSAESTLLQLKFAIFFKRNDSYSD